MSVTKEPLVVVMFVVRGVSFVWVVGSTRADRLATWQIEWCWRPQGAFASPQSEEAVALGADVQGFVSLILN